MNINPLLNLFDSAPFSKIKTEHFLPAFKQEIENTRNEIESIVQNPAPADFTNTLEALEFSGLRLDRISSIFFNLNSAETSPKMQALAQEISPLLTELSNDITLHRGLFERIEKVYQNTDKNTLTPEQQTLLEKKYRHFVRNGAHLPDHKKEELRKLDTELAKLSLKFGENVLAETQAYRRCVENEQELKGLPDLQLEQAKSLAQKEGKKGFVFTLDFPSYQPFMTYVQNRALRKEMYLAYASRGYKNNPNNNCAIVKDIVRKRHQRARLLGYETHAHFVLEERMAKDPETVKQFLDDLLLKATPKAREEFEELEAFARQTEGIEQLQKWDAAYFTEKLKQKNLEFDDEVLKPYFVLDKVLQGVFAVAEKLYGLGFEEVFDIDKYHPEVSTFKVTDENKRLIALFYTDFHPRPGKRNGAWMTSYKPQYRLQNKEERPHISIVCNFSRPYANQPALLTFNEVTTLFHEFGHALHGMLANTTYPSLSGTHVHWDFVELPSQIMENWCYEKEALKLFAYHYKSGELLPEKYLNNLKKALQFMQGLQTLRQLGFGLLDLAWHAQNPRQTEQIIDLEKQVFAQTDFYPSVEDTCLSTAFSHIFQGGYASGYYSYKWAEVLEADAFESFSENGIFDAVTALKFKENILEMGGTLPPESLFQKFKGRTPSSDALLKRAGILATDK